MQAPQWITERDATWSRVEALLNDREQRNSTGMFLVEGVLGVRTALEYGWTVRALLFNSGLNLSEGARSLLDATGGDVYAVAPELMAELGSRFGGVSEITAVLSHRAWDLDLVRPGPGFTAVVCGPTADPSAVGATLRAAHAFSADMVIMDAGVPDPFDPRAVHASAGAVLRVPVLTGLPVDEVIAWTRQHGELTVVGASPTGQDEASAHDFTGPTLLVVADEQFGLPNSWRNAVDATVRTPTRDGMPGVDAAAVATMCLYEAGRQRAPKRQANAEPEPRRNDGEGFFPVGFMSA
ncbi:TrmH family RNA methyltransferase [Salininema proteolyticum]|uniref:TrmH family RNA methyltransferase n=1 Tax=Salininema proteolyticum TaxID=1607685 RepID=A0ABV8TXH7_9ACTN